MKLIQYISNFFNPILSLLVFFFYISIKKLSFKEGLEEFLPLLILLILPIVFWLVRKIKTGKYEDMDVSNRHQRKGFYFFLLGVFGLFLMYDYFVRGNLNSIFLCLFLLLVLMQLSNYLIKSSMHTAFNLFVAALFFKENHSLGWIWLGITILVAGTRIILKRHSLAEVISGFLISILVSAIYLFI